MQDYTYCNLGIGMLVLLYSAGSHYKNRKEVEECTLEGHSHGFTQTTISLIVCITVFLKDIIYTIFYPHLGYFTTLFLWMGLIGPLVYISTRKSLGNYSILKTFKIYFGYEKKHEEIMNP